MKRVEELSMPAENKEVVYGKNSYLVRIIFKKQDEH
jgi:hypothetical protein